jgi:hypothetical protein
MDENESGALFHEFGRELPPRLSVTSGTRKAGKYLPDG